MKKFLLSLSLMISGIGIASADNSADFNTFNGGTAKNQYGTYHTESGWEAVNCQIAEVGDGLGPILDGNTSTVGVVTSPVLTGGIGTISFDYKNPFNESHGVSVRIDILQDNEVVKSETLTNTDVAKDTPYTYTSPELNVAGDFVIKITNLCPSNYSGTSHKDRVLIFNLTWTSFAAGDEPSVATPTFELTKITGIGYAVEMSCETPDATIYYTMDTESAPAAPDNTSAEFTAPIPVSGATYFKAIAYVGDEASYVASFTANPPYVCSDFEGMNDLNTGTKVELEGTVYGVYQNGSNLYVVDTKGNGMLLYGSSSVEVNNGDAIDGLEGTFSPYSGLPEIINYTLGAITEGSPIDPTLVTLSDINDDILNKYVKLNGLKITSSGSAKNFVVTNAAGETMNLYDNFSINVEEGENFTLVGFVGKRGNDLQLLPTEITGGIVMETVATPTFEPESGQLEADTEIVISCETEGATIYYTTDKTNPSADSTKYTGPITFTESVTIRAIALKQGMLDSEIAEAVYTLYDPDAPIPTIVTFDFADPEFLALNELVVPAINGNDICPKGETKTYYATGANDPVIMIVEVAGNASNVSKLWNTGEVRLYAGTTVTFKVNGVTRDDNPEAAKIQKIEFDESASFTASFSPDTYDSSSKIWNGEENAEGAEEFVITPSKRSNFTKAIVSLNTTTGVAAVEKDNSAPEVFYNLQGVRVAQPSNGLYIVVKGNKSKKVMF